MATPIDKFLQGRQENISPVDQYIESLPQRLAAMEPEEDISIIDKFLQGAEGAGKLAAALGRMSGIQGPNLPAPGSLEGELAQGITNAAGRAVRGAETLSRIPMFGSPVDPRVFIPGTEEAALQRSTLAGVASGAVLDPLGNLLEIPGMAFEGEGPTDRMADYLQRASRGLRTRAEEAGLKAGLTDEEIATTHGFGHFLGLTAPMGGSVKAASWLLRSPLRLARYATEGHLVLDFTAGAIYGGLFGEGDSFGERAKDMLKESALFGLGRAMLQGTLFAFSGFRMRRASDMELDKILIERINAMERGEIPLLHDADEAASLMQLLSEENFLASSPAAHRILDRSADQRALVAAIEDLQRGNGSGGLLNIASEDFGRIAESLEMFSREFPGLKFQAVKRSKGSYDIVFGTKGLSGKQTAQLKKEGMFEGQSIYSGKGVEYFYVGKGKKGRIKVKTSSGKVISIKEEGTTVLPKFRESFDFGPAEDALYRDFLAWFEQKGLQMTDAGGGMTSDQIIRAVREGRLTIDESARRAFDVGGAIVYPEEAGLFSGLTRDQLVIVQMFEQARASGSRAEMVATLDAAKAFFQREGLEYLLDLTSPQAHTLSVQRMIAKWQGMVPEELISADGTEMIGLLGPPPAISFERVFRGWMEERGLPMAEDAMALQSFFTTRLREDIWRQLPEEDLLILNNIRDEFSRLVDEGEIPLETLANIKGFRVQKLESGVIEARDALSGLRFRFGDETIARSALSKVVRMEEDVIGSLITPGPTGLAQYGPGMQKATDFMNFSDNIASREFLEDLPFGFMRNIRDYLITIEERTGIPLFSQVFEPIDRALSRARSQYMPFAREIERTWKGLAKEEKIQAVEFWRTIEDTDVGIKEIPALGKEAGLSSKQIRAVIRSRAMFDEAARILNLPRSEYIKNYYSRMQPYADEFGHVDVRRIWSDADMPTEIRYWWEMNRTGEMATVEMDPELVMHKYFRSLFFKKEVAPHWEQAAKLVEVEGIAGTRRPALRIKDLPPEVQERVMTHAAPGTSPESPVLPDPLRKIIKEYLTIVRGAPASGYQSLMRFNRRFFKLLGIEADDRVIEEMSNQFISSMYGSAMGARPAMVNRNVTQFMWHQWTRNGSRNISQALSNTLTREGFEEALEAGAIRSVSSGVPFGDLIHQSIIENAPRGAEGVWSKAVAGTIRASLKAGNVSRKTAENLLIPYSSSEDILRAWSYHEQKLTTGRALDMFQSGKWDWDKTLEEGLAFFAKPVKDQFTRLYNSMGREEALRFAGKMAADEAHFIYGAGAQPAWMQTLPGRFFGMFGTWPMWAIELYGRRAFNGTPRQIAKFWGRTLALIGAFSNMSIQSGIDMWSWISPLSSFTWAGGPATDFAISMKQLMEAPMTGKAGAAERLAKQIGRISVPGQGFYRDVELMADQKHPLDAFLVGMMGRPTPQSHYAFDFIYNPDAPLENPISPATADTMRMPWSLDEPAFPPLGVEVPDLMLGPPVDQGQREGFSVQMRRPVAGTPASTMENLFQK